MGCGSSVVSTAVQQVEKAANGVDFGLQFIQSVVTVVETCKDVLGKDGGGVINFNGPEMGIKVALMSPSGNVLTSSLLPVRRVPCQRRRGLGDGKGGEYTSQRTALDRHGPRPML